MRAKSSKQRCPALCRLLGDGIQRWSREHNLRGQDQGFEKIRGQGYGSIFRKQSLLRPITGMVEAKDKFFFKSWSANFPLFFSVTVLKHCIVFSFL